MGVLNEEMKLGEIFLYDGFAGSTSASHIISVVDHFLRREEKPEKKKLHCTFDNCAVNKNQYVVGYFSYLVASEAFTEVYWHFPVAGHTKFGPDTMFGWLSKLLRKKNLFEVDDILRAGNSPLSTQSYTLTRLEVSDIQNWKEFLEPHVKAVPNITKYHHFRVSMVGDAVKFEMKLWADSGEWKVVQTIKKRFLFDSYPSSLTPVPLNAKKINDLKKLESFVPSNYLSYAHPEDDNS